MNLDKYKAVLLDMQSSDTIIGGLSMGWNCLTVNDNEFSNTDCTYPASWVEPLVNQNINRITVFSMQHNVELGNGKTTKLPSDVTFESFDSAGNTAQEAIKYNKELIDKLLCKYNDRYCGIILYLDYDKQRFIHIAIISK